MKSLFKIIVVILFLGICVLLILNKEDKEINENNKVSIVPDYIFVQINNIELKVEVADTPSERELGLSGHSLLKDDEGMLFVFDEEGNYPFWMKDMHFDIDIIWLDANKKIVFLKENATPESFPETWGGEVKARYVLEVLAGFSKQNNLKVGDSVVF